MNKIILDLANKAGVVFDWDPGTGGPEVYFDRQEDFEKFAEMIVRECATQIDQLEDAVAIYSTRTGKELSKGELIKQHFGVE